MGGKKKKYVEMFGSFAEPFSSAKQKLRIIVVIVVSEMIIQYLHTVFSLGHWHHRADEPLIVKTSLTEDLQPVELGASKSMEYDSFFPYSALALLVG